MTKQEHIEYWVISAKRDWKALQHLFKSKDYMHALFFAHLVLEKLFKANWVKDNKENYPPKIHNLLTLVNNSKLELTEEQQTFVALMNDFQLGGRYPDYKLKMYKRCNAVYTKKILKQAEEIYKCALKNLQ